MNDECFEIEDLEEVIAAQARGEHRAHLDSCPRCRALLASCRAFLVPPDLPPGARVKEAAEGLRLPMVLGLTEDSSNRPGQVAPAPSGTDAAGHRARSRDARQGGSRRWFPFGTPWLRPIWGLAAVVLLVVLVRQVTRDSARNEPSHVMRAEESAAAPAVTLLAPRPAPGGGTMVLWRAVPGADAYTITFYRADLSEIGRRTVTSDTTTTVSSEEAGRLASAALLYWRVRATKSGQEISHSAPGEIRLSGLPGATGAR